jgi:ABC-type amino acid transport substrate-binding protein
MIRFAASLVLGGTGMLAGATRWLAARSEKTFLVARRASSFMATPSVVAFDADWHNPSFAREIGAALKQSAPVEAALLWLHEPDLVLPWLLPELPSGRVDLVLGSVDGRPEIPDGLRQIATVRLGSMRTAHGRRWLTDDEISAAAIASLEDGKSRVVGDLMPPP